MYNSKPVIKLYKYVNEEFKLIAIIDDFSSLAITKNKYEASEAVIEMNKNISNSDLFEVNLFFQCGDFYEDFYVITEIKDSVDQGGKGTQRRVINAKDCRYLLKRRIIKELNNVDTWDFTGTGEDCIKNLIISQCGENVQEKRRLSIDVSMSRAVGIGAKYSVSEAYTNLYDVCVTIATQTEIGWFIKFIEGRLVLDFYYGKELSGIVRFDVDFDSLANGEFDESLESYSNAVYVGGQGNGGNRDIYEGEQTQATGYLIVNDGYLSLGSNSRLVIEAEAPNGINRFESWDNASNLTQRNEYLNESKSILSQYGQKLNFSGNGLAKSPFIFQRDYFVGDTVTVSFGGKSANVQILSVSEYWSWNNYEINFEFGKPIQDLSRQLSVLISQIQKYQATQNTNNNSSIRYYEIPSETEQPKTDTSLDIIGFVGDVGSGAEFKLFLEGRTGAKTYHVYLKQLAGSGQLKLTTGIEGAQDLLLDSGTYVTIIYVDKDGNIVRTI